MTPENKCPLCHGVGAREEQTWNYLTFRSSPAITVCRACNGSGERPTSEQLADAERQIAAALARMNQQIAEAMFPVYEGPALPPPTWQVRARRWLAGFWYGVREWVAVHVLRVEVRGEDDW